jgi:hypothetical protein
VDHKIGHIEDRLTPPDDLGDEALDRPGPSLFCSAPHCVCYGPEREPTEQ